MTKAEARATLATFDAVGGLEAWIAQQPWLAALGGWVVLEALDGWCFRVELAPGGIRVSAFMGVGDPAVWFVPRR